MSYILDALRKADAQRERSRAPGLHDQPVGPAADAPRGWGRSPLVWGAAGVGVLPIALVAWQLALDPDPVPPMPAAAEPAPEVAAAAPAPAAAPAAPVVATAVVPPPPEPKPVPVARPSPPPGAAAASAAAPMRQAGSKPAEPVPVAVAAAAEPGAAPAGAPRLAISGGVYSQDPAQRMLIVGGQVFNEGSEVAPGVRLEQVRQNQAVLSWQGQRYAVRF